MGALFGESIDTRSPTLAPLRDDPLIIAQWVELCLQTPRGFMWSAPEYGCDLKAYVGRGLTDDDFAILPAEIRGALQSDERIANADVALARGYSAGGSVVLKLTITISPKGAEATPFTLTGTASAERVEIILRGL